MSARLSLLVMTLALQGCWLRRPPEPKVVVTTPRPFSMPDRPLPKSAPILEPPVIAAQSIDPAAIPIPPPPDLNLPPPRPRRGNGIAQKKPAAPKVQPVPAPATVPRLGEILSPEIRANYERDFIAHVARAQDVLTQAAGRNLDSIQEQNVERIRAFLSQATQLRDSGDLSNGVEIARRASLLAEDLVRTFR